MSEQILIVADDEGLRAQVGNALKKRDALVVATDVAGAKVEEKMFDLVVIQGRESAVASLGLIEALFSKPNLGRSAFLLLSSNVEKAERIIQDSPFSDVQVLGLPLSPTDLLVKAATVLRLRKMKNTTLAAEFDISTQNAQLRELTAQFAKDLAEAREIQQALLPKKVPSSDRCSFAARYVPLEDVGGDFYDIWQIAPERFGVFIGDVTGHGLPAAFIGAMIKMALMYSKADSAGLVLEAINNGIAPWLAEGRFVTAQCFVIDGNTGKFTISSAGHPAALIYRRSRNETELVELKGFPLGMSPDIKYRELSGELSAGDRLILVTDGLLETSSMDGELFGVERLRRITCEQGAVQLSGLIDALFKAQKDFSGGRLLKDDVTVVGVEWR